MGFLGLSMHSLDASVIVPAYRDIPSLRELLSDLLAQDLVERSWEIIIVDDGSPEPAGPGIEDFLGRTRVPIRCFRKPNGGGPSARNHGAQVATGRILIFIDQDMRIPANFLRAHVDAQVEVGSAAISADYEHRLLAPDGGFSRWYASVSRRWDHAARDGWDEIAPGLYSVHPVNLTSTNLSLPRELFDAAGGLPIYSRTGVEDQAFGLTLGRMRVRVLKMDRVRAVHVETRTEPWRFCDRQLTGMAGTVRLIQEFPDVFGDLEVTAHHRINGPISLRRDPLPLIARKIVKTAVMWPGVLHATFRSLPVVERLAPDALLSRLYDLIVSAHQQRGWRNGLAGR
jgi:hypothetical protein